MSFTKKELSELLDNADEAPVAQVEKLVESVIGLSDALNEFAKIKTKNINYDLPMHLIPEFRFLISDIERAKIALEKWGVRDEFTL